MSLFSELKRRRVFATAVIYVPAAWLAAEIILVIAQYFSASEWLGRVVIVLFLLGFPVALLLSWLFDITKDGVKRASPGTPLGIVTLLASGLFLSAGAYITYRIITENPLISVVILPLEMITSDPTAESYGFGIAESLRSSLRQTSAFSVPGRVSSAAVVKAGLDIPGIAKKLDVQYIVEGTLKIVAQKLDVSISLINNGGNVQWSQGFEGAIEDIFDLHNDIVIAVALQLDLDETDPQLQRIIGKPAPTHDVEAYRLYLQGRRGGEGAAEALKAANERDPGFADVYAALALEYATKCWVLDDRTSSLCDLGVNYADQGLKLDPELGEAMAALAMIYAVRYQYSEAQAAIKQLRALPDWLAHSSSLPYAYINLGRLEEAWNTSVELYKNDRVNPITVSNLALFEWMLRDNDALANDYEKMLIEMGGQSFLGMFPESRVHRVGLAEALEDAKNLMPLFDFPSDLADIIVRPAYDVSYRKVALENLRALYERGDIRFASYWENLISLRQTDEAVDMAFEQFDQDVLNPVMFWLRDHGRQEFQSHPRFIELVEYVGLAEYWDQEGWPIFCEPRGGSHICGVDYEVP